MSIIYLPQHFLYFLPLPHGQGSFRPTFGSVLWIGSTTSYSAGRKRSSRTGGRWFLRKEAHHDISLCTSGLYLLLRSRAIAASLPIARASSTSPQPITPGSGRPSSYACPSSSKTSSGQRSAQLLASQLHMPSGVRLSFWKRLLK